jgi:hypothetical protein
MFFLAMLMFLNSSGASEIDYTTARLEHRLKAVKTDEEIIIDGKLNEPAWAGAPVASDFIQNEPRPGEPASEKTEARILYNDKYIYFGLVMSDSWTNEMITNELKKDFNTDDGDSVRVVLDTFQDERNGYIFATNAEGAKYDAQMINEGREINGSWDGIWYVKTSRFSDGWIAEIGIPLKTLKFRAGQRQTWGINFHRHLRSHGRNEDSFWSPLPRIYDLERVSLAGTLEDLEEIKPGASLKIKPYVTASALKTGTNSYKGDGDFGFDAKYGITTGLTWDFTYNTDFSQVEADEQQINLTRFSLFFPEKRDFFLENSGIFQFGAAGAGVMGGTRQNSVSNDMIFFFSRRIGLSDDGNAIPILGGTRLTGRAADWEIGLLNMEQRDYEDTRATNFTVARLRRNILTNSDIGVMMTNKDVEGSHYNRLIGGDANFRFGQAVSVNAYAVKSFSPLPGRDTKNMAARLHFGYTDKVWNFKATYTGIQENFTNEMGFVPRTGVRKFAGNLAYQWRPAAVRKYIRSVNPHIQSEYILDPRGNTDTRYTDYHVSINFQDGAFAEPGMNQSLELIRAPFTISNRRGLKIPAGLYKFQEYFILARSDRSRALSANATWSAGTFYGGYKHTYQIGATYRVNYKLKTSLTYTQNNISLPQPNGHFKTHLLITRFDYSFSTSVFLNALVQYNSDSKQWSSNVRFNIIHRPLSDLFVVYNERRNSVSGDLMDRALILKFTYMIAR